LVENKIISFSQLEKALRKQQSSGRKLGDVLIELGYLKETDLVMFLAKQLNIPFIELSSYKIKPEVIRELPETIARRLKAIPLDRIKDGFLVAMTDPTDIVGYDEIARKLKKNIRIVIVRESELSKIIDEVYRRTEEIASLVGELEQEIAFANVINDIEDESHDAPIKKLLHSIFEDAIQVHASDIHIEPAEDGLRIRLRVDGVLQEQVIQGRNIVSALVLKLKLIARLNISERRLPQDGRFTIRVKDRKVDVRIATMPVQNGESVVMRLLDKTTGLLRLDDLGMEAKYIKHFRSCLKRPYGMILVTGPTGSGKSTTLYAALSEINSQDKKIITIEDPVEYSFDRINQIQIQPKIGLSFSTVLRSVLRHDPDIIMVGEIRDEETAQIALRSAMTGHMVLSTLHTNDARSAVVRLLDMGIQSYLASSAIHLVIAQRLARRVCTRCLETYHPSQDELKMLSNLGLNVEKDIRFVDGKGCTHCAMRGYKGRIGIYEYLEISESMVDALRDNDLKSYNQLVNKDPLFCSLSQSAFEYAKLGIISLSEVSRLSLENFE
ncbi:MAG TPA: GspE/PulE family protein, partial [Candidatus Berkiella sp.]|nr:GspE/PulE family protein [Candidatus Berkiella sp.]